MKTVDVSALRPGDILLSCGDSDLSLGIKELDGGLYSHAAVWEGSGVIEATLPCVRHAPLAACCDHALLVDAYRYEPEPKSNESVLASARAHIGRPYASMNLAFCTLLVAVSSWMPEEWTEMNTLYGAGRLARMLRLLRTAAGKSSSGERVTCVELVARAHSEAGLPIRIRLKGNRRFNPVTFSRAVRQLVQRLGAPTEPASPAVSEDGEAAFEALDLERELEWLAAFDDQQADWERDGAPVDIRERWFEALGLTTVPSGLELNPEVISAKELVVGDEWAAALLTPRLLESSPSLVCVGRLHER